MISYAVCKLVHYTGIFMILTALGGITLYVGSGGTRANFALRKWAGIIHGVGLFFALLGGFGLLARLFPGMGFPLWIYPKLLIWLVLGAAPVVLYRKPSLAKALWALIVVLAVIAGGFALYKPFGFPNSTASSETPAVDSATATTTDASAAPATDASQAPATTAEGH